jgi:hypothetical protein
MDRLDIKGKALTARALNFERNHLILQGVEKFLLILNRLSICFSKLAFTLRRSYIAAL